MKRRITILLICILFIFNLISFADLDLRFSSKITPSSEPLIAGETITFIVTFINQGSIVNSLLCTGGVDEKKLFERTFASIEADKTRTISFNWTATEGIHFVWFELDPNHKLKDVDYDNNRIELSLNIGDKTEPEPEESQIKPDLVVPDAWAAPYKAEKGTMIDLFCDIKNQGGPINNKWTARFLIGNKEADQMEFDSFAANSYILYKTQIIADYSIGLLILRCEVDPENKIEESDETNNSWVYSFIITEKIPQALPDLIVHSISTNDNMTKYFEGTEVQFVCFYKNSGEKFTGGFKIAMSADEDSEYSDGILLNGYAARIWKAKGIGMHALKCSLDPANNLLESNETNNEKSISIEVLPPLVKLNPNLGNKGVTLYEHDDYLGTGEFFSFNDPDLRDNMIGNDRASSIKIASKCIATLFEHVNYKGKSVVINSDTSALSGTSIGNDSVSSIKVRCQ